MLNNRLQTKFYQNEWQGISLLDIAKELNLSINKLPETDFYEKFYKVLKSNNYQINSKWLNIKNNTSKWMQRHFDKYLSDNNLTKDKSVALSQGVGLGIVEMPLLEDGYNIELQECQSDSLDYILKMAKIVPKVWISKDLSGLPSAHYDLIFVVTVTYCLPYSDLKQAFLDYKRILKPDGKIIILEVVQTWENYFKAKLLPKPSGVLWGWRRGINIFEKLAKLHHLELHAERYLDSNLQAIDAPFRILGLPLNVGNKNWHEMVFVR